MGLQGHLLNRANLLWETELKAGLLSLITSLFLPNKKCSAKACSFAGISAAFAYCF